MCPLLGIWPTTHACAPIGNQTGDPLVHRPMLNPLSYTSQGQIPIFVMHIMAFTLLNNVPSFKNLCVYINMCTYICVCVCVCMYIYIWSNITISLCFLFLHRIWVTLLILAGLALTYWLAGLIWPWPAWVAGLQAVGLATADLQICPKEVMQYVPPGHFCKPGSPIAKLRWAPFLCVSTATPCASLHHFI